MSSTVEQLVFPFTSLDFPGRTTVGLAEIAQRLGCSVDHLLNEAEHGALKGLDLKGAKASRRNIRVPIECYRAYVLGHMTAEFRRDFLRDLPASVKRELRIELIGTSDKAELRELLAQVKAALTS